MSSIKNNFGYLLRFVQNKEGVFMFFDIFYDLCKKKGISCKKAAEDIGLSNSITTKWKKTGATPGGETLNRIAGYFGVSTDYLLGKKEKKAPTDRGECYESLQSNENVIRIAGRDGTFLERSLTDEQLSALVAMINQLPEAEDI